MRLSVNNTLQNEHVAHGFKIFEVNTAEQLQEVVRKSDHSPSVFADGKRSKRNWRSSDFLFMDIDGGISIREFADHTDFKNTDYFLVTSRSHQKSKDGRDACDRFHAFFPVPTISDPIEMEQKLKAIATRYDFADPNAADIARFFFGSKESIVINHPGSVYEPPRSSAQRNSRKGPGVASHAKRRPANRLEDDVQTIPATQRNNTLFKVAARLADKGYSEPEILARLEIENEERCQVPLSRREVQQIAASASRRSFMDGDDPSLIFLPQGDLTRLTTLCWKSLAQANDPVRLMVRARQIVRVEYEPTGVRLGVLGQDELMNELAKSVRFVTKKNRGGVIVVEDAHPPIAAVKNMLASDSFPLPPLKGLTYCPVFSKDGNLRTEPGYDPETELYQVGSGEVVVVTMEPEEARDFLVVELLGDFPFATQADRANAFGKLLDPYVRPLIDGPTPLFLAESPTPGSGKGYLAMALTVPAMGDNYLLQGEPQDDAEFEKRMLANLREGAPRVIIDNINRPIDSGVLAGVLTASSYSGRLLGTNIQVKIPVTLDFIATANNPVLSMEMARRTVRSRLVPNTDKPWERVGFRHDDLGAWVKENRAKIQGACIAIIQGWIAKGMPKFSGKPIGSFQNWSNIVGGIVESVGVEGFLANRDEMFEQGDVDSEAWINLVGD